MKSIVKGNLIGSHIYHMTIGTLCRRNNSNDGYNCPT